LNWLDSRALRIDSISPEPVRRLASILATDRADAEVIAERLKLSTRQKIRLAVMLRPPFRVDADTGPAGLKQALFHLGVSAVRDLVLLGWASELAEQARTQPGRSDRWTALLHEVDAWRPIEFPLKGRDAVALGVVPGPQIGALLRQVELWWEANGYRPSHEECLRQLRSLITVDKRTISPFRADE
jgi:poly(A) polymerase